VLPYRSSAGLVLAALVSAAAAGAQVQRADTVPLSIQEAVGLALRASDEVRLAAAQIDVTEAQFAAARAGVLPQLRLNGTYNHVYQNARAQAVGSIFNQPNTYNVNASLSQPLFQGGRIVAGMRSARRLRGAAELSAGETRAQTTMDVLRAYVDALLAGRVAEIRAANYELAAARVAQTEQLLGAGRAARYDVLRARVERANLEPLVVQARSDRDLALLEVKRLINIPVDRPISLTSDIDTTMVQGVLVAAMVDSAPVGERASVRAAELTARARRDAVAVARADFLPSLSVSLQSGYQAFPVSGLPPGPGRLAVVDCPPGSAAGRVCTQQNGGWFSDRSLAFTVSWPIFDGLRAKANVDLARAQARLADIALAEERENVAVEAARARADLERLRALFSARRQNAEEAAEVFRLASLRYTRGLGTQLEVSDAQLALLTAQTDEANARYDLFLAAAELARALGRPIPMPGGAPVQPYKTSSIR
jgi:outer membrane protein TolC